jgi:hypothetical protein
MGDNLSLPTGRHALSPKDVSWLWPTRIAAGRLTLIDGDPGTGKSLVALDVAARLTAARPLPDGATVPEPLSVLLLPGGEDGLEDTILPRLAAAGADLNRVHCWDDDEPPTFPAACGELERMIRATQARLVLFDPFFAFLGRDTGSLNDLMIRRALAPLARIAEATAAAFLLIRHLGKGSVGKAARLRGLGSLAILGAMRTAFLLANDPSDAARRVLACTKNNLAAGSPSLALRITATATGTARLDWLGPVALTADALVQARAGRGEAIPFAVRFLEEQLDSGWVPRASILQHAAAAGITFRTLERAKAELGVLSQQRREHGRNVWYWRLPSR